jgi:hypothetical protein
VLTAKRSRGDPHRLLGTPGFQPFHYHFSKTVYVSILLCCYVFPKYPLVNTIAEFFSQTSASRELCDTEAKDLVGGEVVPVAVQGKCSYSFYAGPEFDFLVQFRLKSLMLKSEIATLAREVYGSLAPNASFHGQFGEDGKEPLFVYGMNRIHGISYLNFALANGCPENSDENFIW